MVGVVTVGSATLLLKSDSTPTLIPINKPRGTVFWGGAGDFVYFSGNGKYIFLINFLDIY